MNAFSRIATGKAARALLAGGLSAIALASFANTGTGNLTVSATVENQCSVGDATLSLGAITLVDANGTMSANVTAGATANIPYACTNGTSAMLSFGNGNNVAAGGTVRRMAATVGGGTEYLEYDLKVANSSGASIALDDTGTAVSGDGTNKTFAVWAGVVNSAANQLAKPSAGYTDTVVATITFTP